MINHKQKDLLSKKTKRVWIKIIYGSSSHLLLNNELRENHSKDIKNYFQMSLS